MIGFIDFASLAREGKKVLLVSHYDMGKERQDQNVYLMLAGGTIIWKENIPVFSQRLV